jgi:NitT/TauT family transport system permease protein
MKPGCRITSLFVWQLISFALVFGLWELAGRWPISPAFPPASKTFAALARMIGDGSLLVF